MTGGAPLGPTSLAHQQTSNTTSGDNLLPSGSPGLLSISGGSNDGHDLDIVPMSRRPSHISNPSPAHTTPHVVPEYHFFDDISSPAVPGELLSPNGIFDIPQPFGNDGKSPASTGHATPYVDHRHGNHGGSGDLSIKSDNDSDNPPLTPPISDPVSSLPLTSTLRLRNSNTGFHTSSPPTPGRSSLRGSTNNNVNGDQRIAPTGVTFATKDHAIPAALPKPSNSGYNPSNHHIEHHAPQAGMHTLFHGIEDGQPRDDSLTEGSSVSSLLKEQAVIDQPNGGSYNSSNNNPGIYDICSRDEYLWLLQTRQWPAFEDERDDTTDHMRMPEGTKMDEYDDVEDDHAVKCCRRRGYGSKRTGQHPLDHHRRQIGKSSSDMELSITAIDRRGRHRHVSIASIIAASNVVVVVGAVLGYYINPFERSSASSTSSLPISTEVSWAACLHDITRLVLFPLVLVAPWCRSAHCSMLRQLSVLKPQPGSITATSKVKDCQVGGGSSSVWLWQQVQATLWPQWGKDPIAMIALILLFLARSGFGLWAKIDEILTKDYGGNIPERNFDMLRRGFQCCIGLVGLTITSLAFRSRGHRGFAIRRQKVEWVEWSPFLLIGGMMFETFITTIYWNNERPWQWQHIVTSDWTGIFKVIHSHAPLFMHCLLMVLY
jgi:hypothetical protein